MRRTIFAVAACVLAGGAAATAQEPKPVQSRPAPVISATRAQLEEEVELLEVELLLRKAQFTRAGFDAKRNELALERLRKLLDSKSGQIVSRDQVEDAEFALRIAQTQLEIHAAELKQTEVKLKYARKRLEAAKAVGGNEKPREGGAAPEKKLKEIEK